MLTVRAWTETEFAAARQVWQSLLKESGADPLFMSWDWQWRWWTHHSALLGAKLLLLGMYRDDGELVAILPFYSRKVRSRAVIKVARIELIGVAWRNDVPAFSEYLDFIAARRYANDVLRRMVQWLQEQGFWDEIVLACVRPDSLAARLAREHLQALMHVREVDPMVSHTAQLPRSFAEYVQKLGPGTRRRLFNHRRKLGEPRITRASAGEVGEYLGRLRKFKSQRWRSTLDEPAPRAFHDSFADCMALQHDLQLTQLMVDGRPVSVMYNVRAGETEYYLQSAFDTEGSSGVSPGYLHFGYAIEQACNDGVARFDLLGGTGLNRDYKKDLKTEPSHVSCYHGVRTPWLRALHAAHGLLTRSRH